MQITDSLIKFLNAEYTDEKTKRSLYVNSSMENINKLNSSCIDEANLIYNLMSLCYLDKTGKYEPQLILADGRRTFAVNDINDEAWSFLKQIVEKDIPIVLRARIADLFWVAKGDYQFSKRSINYYLELYQLTFDICSWVICEHYIKRALQISLSLGKTSNEFKSTCSYVREELKRIDAEDPLFLSIELISDLVDVRAPRIGSLIPLIDKIISLSASDVGKAEMAFKLKISLVKESKEQLNKAHKEFALFLENYASKYSNDNYQGITSKVYFLKKAIIEYKYSRDKEDENRLLLEVEKLQALSMASMPSISIPFEIEKSFFDIIYESIDNNDFDQSVLLLTSMFSFRAEDEIKDGLKKRKTGLFSSFFASSILDSNGKNAITIPPIDFMNPGCDKKVLEQHLIREAHVMEEFEGFLLYHALKRIIDKYNPTDEQIESLLKAKYLIPDGRLPIFVFALHLVFSGHFYAAIHILSAQMEHLFRMIAKKLGDVTYRIEDKFSRETEISLSEVFDLPHMSECLDERVLFTFKGLMNERAGANIRNRVAHGIMNPDEGSSGIAIYFVCAVLKFLMGNY